MDRPDEKRGVARDSNVVRDRRDSADRIDEEVDRSAAREGDVLGLGGAAVPKAPGDPSASDDPESVARRRARGMGADEDVAPREDPYRQSAGATGIDMGAGGEGTDVSGK
jgi:hypothetical protein